MWLITWCMWCTYSPKVDRQTPVITLPSVVIGNESSHLRQARHDVSLPSGRTTRSRTPSPSAGSARAAGCAGCTCTWWRRASPPGNSASSTLQVTGENLLLNLGKYHFLREQWDRKEYPQDYIPVGCVPTAGWPYPVVPLPGRGGWFCLTCLHADPIRGHTPPPPSGQTPPPEGRRPLWTEGHMLVKKLSTVPADVYTSSWEPHRESNQMPDRTIGSASQWYTSTYLSHCTVQCKRKWVRVEWAPAKSLSSRSRYCNQQVVHSQTTSNVSRTSCCEIDVRPSQRSADPARMQTVQMNLLPTSRKLSSAHACAIVWRHVHFRYVVLHHLLEVKSCGESLADRGISLRTPWVQFLSFSRSFRQRTGSDDPLADLRSRLLPSPGRQNSFDFMQFSGNFGHSTVCWRARRAGAPNRGNPESASG